MRVSEATMKKLSLIQESLDRCMREMNELGIWATWEAIEELPQCTFEYIANSIRDSSFYLKKVIEHMDRRHGE